MTKQTNPQTDDFLTQSTITRHKNNRGGRDFLPEVIPTLGITIECLKFPGEGQRVIDLLDAALIDPDNPNSWHLVAGFYEKSTKKANDYATDVLANHINQTDPLKFWRTDGESPNQSNPNHRIVALTIPADLRPVSFGLSNALGMASQFLNKWSPTRWPLAVAVFHESQVRPSPQNFYDVLGIRQTILESFEIHKAWLTYPGICPTCDGRERILTPEGLLPICPTCDGQGYILDAPIQIFTNRELMTEESPT